MIAPLQDLVEYETRFFEEVIDRSTSIYSSDPSDEVDRAWSALYNGTHVPCSSALLAHIQRTDLGMTQISRAEAERLPNKTVPIPADPSQYLMLPTVLHHLHCVVGSSATVRKYTPDTASSLLPEHLTEDYTQGLLYRSRDGPAPWSGRAKSS